jgi:cell division protease FtsH
MAILLVFLVYFLVQGRGMCSSEKQKEIPTSDFVTAVKEGRVTEVTYKASSSTLEGKYYETPAAKERGSLTPFTSAYVGEDNLDELMAHHSDIVFNVDTSDNELWETLLVTFVPTLIMVGIFIYFMNQIQGQTMTNIARTGETAAATMIITMVPILIFIFSQSRILETMASSGIKE